jgi:hypothetical protein
MAVPDTKAGTNAGIEVPSSAKLIVIFIYIHIDKALE